MMRRGILPLAIAASCGIHFALAGAWPEQEITVSGGDMAGKVALGTSFADLVAGTLRSAAPEGEIEPTSATATTAPLTPTDRVASQTNTATPPAPPTVSASALPTVVTSNTAPDVTPPTEARDALALTTSVRPVARPARQQPPAPQETTARRGNADVNAATGQQAGTQTGTVAQSSAATQTTARQVGQGEINDYKSRVASRVIRVAERMRSRGTEGTVVVGMQIAANGGLAAATVSQSTGNPNADAIALDAVRRAAPFDPTPSGQGLSVAFRVQLVAQ